MLNWYRASELVVPAAGEAASAPAWTNLPFPHLTMPTLVVWALSDKALLPVQLDGLDDLVDDLRDRDGRRGRPFRSLGESGAVARRDPRLHGRDAATEL